MTQPTKLRGVRFANKALDTKIWLFGLASLFAMGCADMSSEDVGINDLGGDDVEEIDDDDDGANNDDDDDVSPDDGEEDEDPTSRFTVPQISGAYIYAANTETGKVAVVNSTNLAIQVVPVGAQPLIVRALVAASDDQGAAAVLHADAALAILSTDAAGSTTVAAFHGVQGANALSSSDDGRFVVVYHDVDEVAAQGPGSDQEIVIVDRSNGASYPLSVGLHPYDVSFSVDKRSLYVHTQDGISSIDLATLSPNSGSRLIAVLPNGINPNHAEVVVVSQVNQALVRVADQSTLYMTDLVSGAQSTLDLGAVPNDLDVQANAASVVLTIPGQPDSQLLEIALPAQTASPIERTILPGITVGSAVLAATGTTAILYATDKFNNDSDQSGEDPQRFVSIASKNGASWTLRQTLFTEATVRAVGVAPDAGSAILVHDYAPDLNASAPWPYTMLDLRSTPALRKVQSSLAQATRVVFSPDGSYAGLLLRNDTSDVRQIDVINLRSLVVKPVVLGSPPQDLGYVSSNQSFFVGQVHPAGRISFIDVQGQQRTLTGFELGSR